MSSYSENTLVEQPTIDLFEELGYEVFRGGKDSRNAELLGRSSSDEVVLSPRLRSALQRLNPTLPPEAIEQAVEKLTKDRSLTTPAQANQEVYRLLKNGIRVTVAHEEGERVEIARVIDWDEPRNNDFLLASQLTVTGEVYTRRPDLLGFVNGLPLVFVELKAPERRVENAYRDNLRDYKQTIPQLFTYNALIILSNGSETKVGSMTASWEHFNEWKKISSEGEEGRVSLETTIRGTCEKARLLDIVELHPIL